MSLYLFLVPTRSLVPSPTTVSSAVCVRCRRSFASSSMFSSGHNRWSKIKHEKGAADAKKTAQRSALSKSLTLYTKLYGPDPNLNSQLASWIAAAKKAGMPKASIDSAIARGQGKSSSGAGLESITLEVMMPPAVAIVIDIETDNKQRTLQELRTLTKKHKGTVTPTAFLFTRWGRTTLKGKGGEDFDEVMMQALDAGAEDVEQDENNDILLWTQPNTSHQVAQELSKVLSTEVLDSEIIWSPTADKVKLDDTEAATALGNYVAALQEYPDVQGVYSNVEQGAIPEEVWKTVEDNLDA
ncbi:YebC-like protein [Hypomontagnella monticulosa]|nr:YebC-like protein [Hypomontagnella monticulosa]